MPSISTPFKIPVKQNHDNDGDNGYINRALTQNVWVTLLSARNVRLCTLSFLQLVANEDIEVRIIADDTDTTVTQTAVAGTTYYVRPSWSSYGNVHWAVGTTEPYYKSFNLDATNLQILIRKTTAAGANNTISCARHGLFR